MTRGDFVLWLVLYLAAGWLGARSAGLLPAVVVGLVMASPSLLLFKWLIGRVS